MKALFKNSTKRSSLIFSIFLAALFWTGGCATQTPDPLTGWHLCFSQDPGKLDKAIRDDYQDYIHKLPPKERDHVGGIDLFEDGTGQHAVDIEVYGIHPNAEWYYAIFYDKENKRIKAVKYGYGRIIS